MLERGKGLTRSRVTSKRIQKRLDALEKDKYAGRGDDMMQAFIDSGLTRDELLAEIMLEL